MMKCLPPLALALVALTSWSSGSDSLTLTRLDGVAYEDVKLRRVEEGKAVLQHQGGFATVPLGLFSDNEIKKMGLDPEDFAEIPAQREEASLRINLFNLKKRIPSFQITQGIQENVKTSEIEDIDPITILVVTDGVPRRIPLATLPKDIKQALGYDPEKAQAFVQAREDARQAGLAAAAQVQAEEEKRKAQAEKARQDALRKQPKKPTQPTKKGDSGAVPDYQVFK
jgi:hypothetical protein